MVSTAVCSFDGCKRPVTCLCHHCQKNVCFKHFNKHQAEINNQLVPLADRLNELKMKLRIEEDRTGPLAMLKTWREKKYEEIDKEYNEKVQEFNNQVSKQEEQVSQTIREIDELVQEGDASIDQVKELKKSIDLMENQVKKLMMNEQTEISSENNVAELNLVNTHVYFGVQKYFVKGKVYCMNTDLYALESERSLPGYDGLCTKCQKTHVALKANRGYYVTCEDLHGHLQKLRKEPN